MEDSILKSTKRVLGVAPDDHVFDLDILLLINSTFSTLNQLGIGPNQGFSIEDDSATWSSYLQGDERFESVKTYVQLNVRLMFDPPQSSFVLAAMKEKIDELTSRLSIAREYKKFGPVEVEDPISDGVLDGGNPAGVLNPVQTVIVYDGGKP